MCKQVTDILAGTSRITPTYQDLLHVKPTSNPHNSLITLDKYFMMTWTSPGIYDQFPIMIHLLNLLKIGTGHTYRQMFQKQETLFTETLFTETFD